MIPFCVYLTLQPTHSPLRATGVYGEHTGLPQLRTRESYKQPFGWPRALHVVQRVREHRPKAVIFYSFDNWYRKWWQLLAGVPFTEQTGPHGTFHLASNGATSFAIVKHPASKGLTNHYWQWVGQSLTNL